MSHNALGMISRNNSGSLTHGHSVKGSAHATSNSPRWLVDSFIEMLGACRSVSSLKYKRADAKRGRPIAPLGTFPDVADRMLNAGTNRAAVEKPLRAMLAYIATRCRNGLGFDIREALTRAKRERAEAECAELKLAMSVQRPERSILAEYIREEREAICAEEHAVEVAEQLMIVETNGSGR